MNYALTTGEGSGFDYTVSTNQVRFLYRRPDPPEDITFIFRTDAIAQEEKETLTLELVTTPRTNAPPSGDGVFFRNTINLTIMDSDSKISDFKLFDKCSGNSDLFFFIISCRNILHRR